MAGNAAPIFSKVGQIDWGTVLTAANTAVDGTGTVITVFTADATNGGWCEELIWMPLGTNVVTVGRAFVNNGSTNGTAANNSMISQIQLPATTLNNAAPLFVPHQPIRLALPAGYKINVVIATAVSAGFMITGVGGKY